MLQIRDAELPKLLFRIAQHGGKGRIAGLELALHVGNGDAGACMLKNAPEPLLAHPQRLFGSFTFADIAHERPHSCLAGLTHLATAWSAVLQG